MLCEYSPFVRLYCHGVAATPNTDLRLYCAVQELRGKHTSSRDDDAGHLDHCRVSTVP